MTLEVFAALFLSVVGSTAGLQYFRKYILLTSPCRLIMSIYFVVT